MSARPRQGVLVTVVPGDLTGWIPSKETVEYGRRVVASLIEKYQRFDQRWLDDKFRSVMEEVYDRD